MTMPTATDQPARKRAPRKKSTSHSRQHAVRGGSSEANRLVVAILEVLAGLRTPAEAAASLKISLPRYYTLETRALEGMVAACEPKTMGKQPSLETRIASLEKQLQQAHRESARQQALVRAAQRSVGLSATDAQKGKNSSKRDRRGRKRRRPTVRALKVVDALQNRIATAQLAELQQPTDTKPLADTTEVGPKEDQTVASC